MNATINIGDWITVEEADYCYGIGTLTLEITAVGKILYDANDEWLQLRGRTVYWNNTLGEDRVVAVRLSVLEAARRAGSQART